MNQPLLMNDWVSYLTQALERHQCPLLDANVSFIELAAHTTLGTGIHNFRPKFQLMMGVT